MPGRPEDVADLFISNRRIEVLADYARRGRRFAGLRLSHLEARRAASFRRWARNVCDEELREEWEDLACELRLRGAEEPVERVSAEWETAWQAVAELVADPDRYRRLLASVSREYATYRAAIAASRRRPH
jgi:hypothetical protein